jgi:two-component system nitrate/nitrite response regulator NarL
VSKVKDVHLFICPRGQTLPRWREAFRSARAAKLVDGELSKPAQLVRLVWIRLEHGRPIEEQMGLVPAPLRHLPVVIMSDLPEDEEALAAFSAGARGYCNTHALPAVLQQVSAVVLEGGLWIGESLMQRLLKANAGLPRPGNGAAAPHQDWSVGLTDREKQVAQAVSTGSSNKEVARALGISDRTVKAHVGAVLEKLGARDRLQLSLIVHGQAARPCT